MKIVEVTTPQLAQQWVTMVYNHYKNDANYIPHMENDIEAIFDPKKNRLFKFGDKAVRYLLYDDNGQIIGRAAAFTNKKASDAYKQPTGGMGFFECIDNQQAANMLFDACKQWNLDQGMKAMDGPINFGERDSFWGCLIDNFTDPNIYRNNYNPPYYAKLFENYGFQTFFEQYGIRRELLKPAEEIYYTKSEWARSQPNLTVKNIHGMSWEQVAKYFVEVYNGAWAGHDGAKEMTLDQGLKAMSRMKPIADKDIVMFAFDGDRPIGFYINIPQINPIMQRIGRRLTLWGKLKFLYLRTQNICPTMAGVIFGIIKEYHGKGIEALMVVYADQNIRSKGKYKDTIVSWVGDFNLKMLKIRDNLGFYNWRTWKTYRLMLDPSLPFERMPYLGDADKMKDEKN